MFPYIFCVLNFDAVSIALMAIMIVLDDKITRLNMLDKQEIV
jgi:hypothetical protein